MINDRDRSGCSPSPRNCTESYAGFCREERNFAAVLYALLGQKNEIENFLKLCGVKAGSSEPQVYFEFAFLRDWWVKKADSKARADLLDHHLPKKYAKVILSKIDANRATFGNILAEGANADLARMNKALGVSGQPSRTELQMPGRWRDGHIAQIVEDKGLGKECLREICRFKWAFNIKPDIVIILDQGADRRAVCIEAKMGSREGRYALPGLGRAAAGSGTAGTIGQLEVQRYLMERVLGFDTTMVYVTRSGLVPRDSGAASDPRAPIGCSWRQVFGSDERIDRLELAATYRRLAMTACAPPRPRSS